MKKVLRPGFRAWFLSAVSLFVVFFLFSCGGDSGLGEEVDLTPPVISVKSMSSEGTSSSTFAGGVYCHKAVSFSGSASDNNRISKIYTQIKWAGESSEFSYFKEATFSQSGETDWSLDFTFEKEGVALLKFIATDPAGNIGTKSTKTLILFVDETAPGGNAWYLDRKINGIQYKLHELDYLKSLDLNESSNIDAAQNMIFSISAAFTDKMGVSTENSPNISLYDESGKKICIIEKSEDSSVYQPEFKISHDLLVQANPDLASGMHYLQVRYSASDIVTLPHSNAVDDEEFDGGWFLWYPESDTPRYEISEELSVSGEGSSLEKSITVYVNSAFSITVFDDDELESAGFEFTYLDENEEQKSDSESSEINEGEREKTLAVKVPSTPQTAILKISAQGKAGQTDGGKILDETITVNVIDATAPMLLITSPKNNSVPEVVMSDNNANAKVTISGTSLDVAGCNYLEFVWVPDSIASTTAEKTVVAKTFLSSLTTDSMHESYSSSGSAKKTEISGTGVLWSVPLSGKTTKSGFIIQDFSFDIDLFNDFADENKTTSDKFFVARLTRSGETGTYAEYKLSGDISNPTISSITPVADMAIVSGEENLVLEFKGVKESGMPMDNSSYEIRRVDDKADDGKFSSYDSAKGYGLVEGSFDSGCGTYKSVAIPRESLQAWKTAGTKPKFLFIAKDLLGNEGSDQFTIVISTLPVLKSVTSPSSTLLKKGDELLINAVFDNTVSVAQDDLASIYVKLKGFSDSQIRKAVYKSGSGSTTLIFSYIVQDGDSSDQVQIENGSGSPLVGLSSSIATLQNSDNSSIVGSDNLLQAKKTIAVDGVPPVATIESISCDISSSQISEYQKDGVTYLNEGRTLTVTITTGEDILISGSPEFVFSSGSSSFTIPFTGCTGRSVTFSKKIESSDVNGNLKYTPANCISDSNTITDSAGNAITLPSSTTSTDSKFIIDTVAPSTPTIVLSDEHYSGTINDKKYYANSVEFTPSSDSTDSSIRKIEYSVDGGSKWKDAVSSTPVTLTAENEPSVQLTVRAKDYAGNVSDQSEIINLEINSTFPDFSIECTNPDGNYKAGSKLIFKLSFADKVQFTTDSLYTAEKLKSSNPTCSYIQLSALEDSETCGGGANKGRAYLSDKNGNALTSVTSSSDTFYFTYDAQDPDQFSLKVAAGEVHLAGFKDLYGISQGNKALKEDYSRSGIKCDGVAPKVVSMTPQGTQTTSDGINVYSQGNKITLVFNEPVQKSSGNITLRQVAGWAIPPVLSASDFNTICNNLDDADKEYLAMRDTDGSYLEDAQPDLGITNGQGFALDLYHGTGQFVGPYKKSMQGLKTNSSGKYIPDTDTKFVLDFDIDIWETDTKHYFGKTYTTYTQSNFHTGAFQDGRLVVNTPSSERTAQGIRERLEKAGYHERLLDVTSSSVEIGSDNKTVTITFSAGLCDKSDDLPSGRQWELVIDKGSFMDMTGNDFGAESNGEIAKADAVQSEGVQYTVGSSVTTEYEQYSGSWARKNSSTENPVVLICNGSNEYFYSDKVATPVVRVDRYSYGFGIYQSDENGNKSSIIADSGSTVNGNTVSNGVSDADAVQPTGYVRVRIDCETKGSTVSYTKRTASSSTSSTLTETYTPSASTTKLYEIASTTKLYEIASPSSLSSFGSSESVSGKSNVNLIFAGGNGSYNQACKQFVIAQATKDGLSASLEGSEGIWQTVVCYDPPLKNTRRGVAENGDGWRNYYIRGTTSYGGEPYISPFPLRGGLLGTPYVRATYRENNGTTRDTKYYWVSYEVLVESSFLGRGSNGAGWTWNDSATDQGKMLPGVLSVITNMYLYN